MARKTIGLEQLDNFSVDERTNEIYWRDKLVVTTISLPVWLQVAAIAGGFGAFASGLVDLIKLFR